ncbi:S41 family peptidase [Geoalkalibacter sp.]|uniref:S41 family peptidase n=1 Tax=Geoalkalibacter sp. TaxID=3041440 RepID=UPI00272DD765|nr:S41 family peptidase [Geoalkalibacter sp.]
MAPRRRPVIFLLLVALLVVGLVSTDKVHRLAVAQAGPAEYQELDLFTDVLALVRKSYVEEVPLKDLIQGAINGMLAALDPHSSFLPPEMYQEMKIDTRGEFGGLGIEISIRDGILTIVAPIEDTPAHRAGLKAGDQILKIEDRFTKDMSIMDAVKLMRGKPGTAVTITIMRDLFEKPQEFTLKREIIKVRSIRSQTLEDGFGYLRITQFQERTADDLHKALAQLRKENQGVLQGLVLDLRNNPGGLLDQAVEVADAFLREGLIVYTEGREPASQLRFSARKSGSEPDYPMVVLINGGSASASEIVAGALQDHRRAVVMGTQSFGKGSVQTIIPLGDQSGLRLTTARYFTPNGTSIQARGITPDILVHPMEVSEAAEENHLREKDLEQHMDGAAPTEGEPQFQLDEQLRKDYQLMRALDLLKGWQLLKKLDPKAA